MNGPCGQENCDCGHEIERLKAEREKLLTVIELARDFCFLVESHIGSCGQEYCDCTSEVAKLAAKRNKLLELVETTGGHS